MHLLFVNQQSFCFAAAVADVVVMVAAVGVVVAPTVMAMWVIALIALVAAHVDGPDWALCGKLAEAHVGPAPLLVCELDAAVDSSANNGHLYLWWAGIVMSDGACTSAHGHTGPWGGTCNCQTAHHNGSGQSLLISLQLAVFLAQLD